MGRVVLIILLIALIPFAIQTWWRMRRARSAKERAFIGRTRTGGAMLVVLAATAFVMLGLRGQFIALPIIVVAGIAYRHVCLKARARIQAEDADPLLRAKRVN